MADLGRTVMAQLSIVREMLKYLMLAGVMLILIGPCAKVANEGMGGPPGPIATSQFWMGFSYVSIPLGALLTVGAGIALVIWDRRAGDSGTTATSDESPEV